MSWSTDSGIINWYHANARHDKKESDSTDDEQNRLTYVLEVGLPVGVLTKLSRQGRRPQGPPFYCMHAGDKGEQVNEW